MNAKQHQDQIISVNLLDMIGCQLSLAHLLLFVLFDGTVTHSRAFKIDITDQTNCQMWFLNSSVSASYL